QHFQTQDDYFEGLFQFRFAASHFANWGMTDLNIDEQSLANGFFSLRHCRGVFPDGLLFDIPESDDLPPGRAVEEFFLPTQEALDVYLAAPEQRPGGRNFTLLANNQSPNGGSHSRTRYVAETRMMLDENLGAEEKPVQVARKSFTLLFGGENLDGFTAM